MEMLLLKKIVSPEVDVTGSAEGKALIEAISTLVQKEKNDVPDRSGAEIVKPWDNNKNEGSRNRTFQSRPSGRSGRGGGQNRGFRGQNQGGRGHQRS